MAARLRVSCDALHSYARPPPDRHHKKEGCVFRIARVRFDGSANRCAASYLEPLKGGKVPIEILVRGKDAEENKKQFQTCIETLKNAGKKVAVLKKDNSAGGFADEWKAAFAEAGIKEEDQVDLAPILSQAALSIKDERELVGSSHCSCILLRLTLPAHHSRCFSRIERPHDQLLRRGNVRHSRF